MKKYPLHKDKNLHSSYLPNNIMTIILASAFFFLYFLKQQKEEIQEEEQKRIATDQCKTK